MLVRHVRKEFYELLFGKRVLLMSNFDVDSVCTTNILVELFKIDGISFSLCPVDGLAQMKAAWNTYKEMSSVVVLINCGMGIDVRAFFGHPKNTLIFILDCHRPVHVANYYDETNQVRIITLDEEFDELKEAVPEFDDIFWEEFDDEENENSESDMEESLSEAEDEDENEMLGSDEERPNAGQRRGKKRKARSQNVSRQDKQRKRLEWRDRRDELIYLYTQYCSFAPPSTLVALELSWSISRGDLQYVWWAAVALTDSFVLDKIPRTEYTRRVVEMSLHIARESRSSNTARDCLKVNFESKELHFYLYRHWSLYDSIKMTPHCASTLKTWSLKGESRFHEMLGELGFPQVECRQKFGSMDIRYRKKIKEAFNEKIVEHKYKLTDIVVGSFTAQVGFKPPLSAFDCQLACLALLENPDKRNSKEDNFLAAMTCLSKRHFDTVYPGIELAKIQLTAAYRQVQEFINMNCITPRGGYLYVAVPEGSPNACYFQSSSTLTLLAQFTQRAAVATAKSRRWASLPLVLSAPVAQSEGWVSLIGIKPHIAELPKNLFGKVFETLAEKLDGTVLLDSVDPFYITVKGDSKEKFLQCLEACMI